MAVQVYIKHRNTQKWETPNSVDEFVGGKTKGKMGLERDT